jgi:hypothetical protein
MSSAYQAKNQATCNQILKVQEIKVRGQDPQSYSTTIPNNTGVVCILILEPVNAVVDARIHRGCYWRCYPLFGQSRQCRHYR